MPPIPFHPSAKVALIEELARERPTAWIDDAHTLEALTWSNSRTEPTLLLTVNPATGLTRALIDQALAWPTSL